MAQRSGPHPTDPESHVTSCLESWRAGDDSALDRMMPHVYDELRRIAHLQLRGQPAGHTLNTTALVHEAYMRLVDQTRSDWADRAHFFALAARAMRQILIDYARRVGAAKRGGGWRRIDFDKATLAVEEQADLLLDLDEALRGLGRLDPRLARVVECRFFGGMTDEETAIALGVTDRTVRRDWVKARLWLHQRLSGHDAGDAGVPEGPSGDGAVGSAS